MNSNPVKPARLAKIQGATLYLQPAQDIAIGARIAKTQYQYPLFDADSNELDHWAAIFLDKLKTLPQISDVATDQESAGPMLNVTANREVASSFGILPATIDNTLDDAFGQRIVTTMYTELNQYHVILEVAPQFQYGPEALKDIYVGSSTNQQVPLSTLVNSNIKPAPRLACPTPRHRRWLRLSGNSDGWCRARHRGASCCVSTWFPPRELYQMPTSSLLVAAVSS